MSSQADSERADLGRERADLRDEMGITDAQAARQTQAALAAAATSAVGAALRPGLAAVVSMGLARPVVSVGSLVCLAALGAPAAGAGGASRVHRSPPRHRRLKRGRAPARNSSRCSRVEPCRRNPDRHAAPTQ